MRNIVTRILQNTVSIRHVILVFNSTQSNDLLNSTSKSTLTSLKVVSSYPISHYIA